MALDPTRTTILRRNLTRGYGAMWARVDAQMRDAIQHVPVYLTRAEHLAWIEQRMRAIVADEGRRTEADPARGAVALLESSYMQGLALANYDAKAARIDFYEEVERPQVLVQQPDHRDELAALLLLLLSDWQGIQAATVQQALRAYVAGLDDQAAPALLHAGVRDRLQKIGRTRSSVMVASYVVASVNTAILRRAGQLGARFVTLEEELEFVTAGDSRVCRRCRGLAQRDNGFGPGIYSIEQARGVIPVHGRCRCRWRIARSGRAVFLDEQGRLERI